LSSRSTQLARGPKRLFTNKLSSAYSAAMLPSYTSQAKLPSQCRTSARLKALERRTASRFLFLRRKVGLALMSSSSTEHVTTNGTERCKSGHKASAMSEKKVSRRKNGSAFFKVAGNSNVNANGSRVATRSVTHHSVNIHKKKHSTEAHDLEEISRKFICKPSSSSTQNNDLASVVREPAASLTTSSVHCQLGLADRPGDRMMATSDSVSAVVKTENSSTHLIDYSGELTRHPPPVSPGEVVSDSLVTTKKMRPDLPVNPSITYPDRPMTVLMSMGSPSTGNNSCELLHGTVSLTPGNSLFMSSYVVSSGFLIQQLMGGQVEYPSTTYVQQSPEVACLDTFQMPLSATVSHLHQVVSTNQSTQLEFGEPTMTVCPELASSRDCELSVVCLPSSGVCNIWF